MQISRATDYAVLGLARLAAAPAATASVGQLAAETGISLYFLRKVFQRLKAAGLVASQKSTGYRLAHAPEKISLRAVVEAVEGPVALQTCLRTAGSCGLSPTCRAQKVWGQLQKNWLANLEAVNLTHFSNV